MRRTNYVIILVNERESDLETEEAAKRAMALDGGDMGGFFLKVQRYNKTTTRVEKTPAFSPPVIQGYNRIYAGNLSWDITEEDLRSFFSDCSVSSIRFGEDKETGEFKGYAHVDFSDSTSLAKALEMDQKVVCGRPVRITCAVALRKGKPYQSTSKDTANNNHTSKDTANNNYQSTTEAAVYQSTTMGTADNKAVINLTTTVGAAENKTGVSWTTTVGAAENKAVVSLTTTEGAADNKADVSFTVTVGAAENNAVVSAGKLRRRNCYLCGERGHISSACPKQAAQETNPSTTEAEAAVDQSTTIGTADNKAGMNLTTTVGAAENKVGVSLTTTVGAAENKAGMSLTSTEGAADNKADVSFTTTVGAAENKAVVSAGKLRRRNCYLCGERGHISSACPKQAAQETNPSTG